MVALTGGLGNQLFQLAAGLTLSAGENLYFDWNIGKPRLNSKNMPEISSFNLPLKVSFIPRRRWSKLVEKSTGYILRMGIAPRKFEKRRSIKLAINFIANLVTTLYFRSRRSVLSPIGVGYSSFKIPNKKVLVSGYFQSYKWGSSKESKKILKNLRISSPGPQLLEFEKLSVSEKPLIVHIRLGDYKHESDFGILSKDYFLKSIKTIEPDKYSKIWAFSDEPEIAKEYIPNELKEDVRWIPEIDGSAASTLELMRHGSAYVISNSTFSWWGAFLSYAENPTVVAPQPWFLNMASPIDLIPPTWRQIPGW